LDDCGWLNCRQAGSWSRGDLSRPFSPFLDVLSPEHPGAQTPTSEYALLQGRGPWQHQMLVLPIKQTQQKDLLCMALGERLKRGCWLAHLAQWLWPERWKPSHWLGMYVEVSPWGTWGLGSTICRLILSSCLKGRQTVGLGRDS
jgi:hypothetical protein